MAALPQASCARSTQKAHRSAKPATLFRHRIARPKRRSIFRWSCATTSRVLKYPAKDLQALCKLLDKRWRRRAIGVVSGSTNETAQPLLASTFYLTRALAPFADVRLGDRGAPQQAITQFSRPEAADDRARGCRHAVAGNSRTHQRVDRVKAGCWCVLPARGWRRRMTTWCR